MDLLYMSMVQLLIYYTGPWFRSGPIIQVHGSAEDLLYRSMVQQGLITQVHASAEDLLYRSMVQLRTYYTGPWFSRGPIIQVHDSAVDLLYRSIVQLRTYCTGPWFRCGTWHQQQRRPPAQNRSLATAFTNLHSEGAEAHGHGVGHTPHSQLLLVQQQKRAQQQSNRQQQVRHSDVDGQTRWRCPPVLATPVRQHGQTGTLLQTS